MSVALDPPSQLIFKRPLTQPIEEILYVKNVGNEPLAFKVKTTAPKKYCVRPNSSIIEPGSHVEVQIVFQPFREEPPPDYKCKDKFLVQTAVVKPEWLDWNMIELWNHIEMEYKDTISQNKVKCVFLPPELPQPYLNDESLEDNPPTPTLSHAPSVMETVKDDAPARQSSPPPSPTLVSTLPAIIDAARRASASQPPRINTNTNSQLFNDANTSSVSLSSHYTSRQTPSLLNTTTTTTTNGSVSTLPNSNSNNNNNNNNITTLSQEPSAPSTLVISLEKTIQEQQTQINNLENEKKLLDQQIVDYRLKQTTLQQQLNKQEKDISTVTTLKDQLKQTIQTLEEENRKQQQEIIQLKKQSIDNKSSSSSSSSSSTTVAAHAMQTSSLPTEGYPPQVLLSVSILIFILTYLFF